jgi:hypothetical protein
MATADSGNENARMATADSGNITLRVAGLGHSLTFQVSATATVGDVKAEIEKSSSLPAPYQRLVARGKKLDDDQTTLKSAGIQDRTRLMLLHNELYAADREGFTAISALVKEIDDLAAANAASNPAQVREMVTQICIKLDSVDTHGSKSLRDFKRQAIAKAEAIENKSAES